jgi:hypothetical protein
MFGNIEIVISNFLVIEKNFETPGASLRGPFWVGFAGLQGGKEHSRQQKTGGEKVLGCFYGCQVH